MAISHETAEGFILPTPIPPGQHRKIIQIVPFRNVLIALTDDSEIWMLHGIDAVGAGTEPVPTEWRLLSKTLPPKDTLTPVPQTSW